MKLLKKNIIKFNFLYGNLLKRTHAQMISDLHKNILLFVLDEHRNILSDKTFSEKIYREYMDILSLTITSNHEDIGLNKDMIEFFKKEFEILSETIDFKYIDTKKSIIYKLEEEYIKEVIKEISLIFDYNFLEEHDGWPDFDYFFNTIIRYKKIIYQRIKEINEEKYIHAKRPLNNIEYNFSNKEMAKIYSILK